VELQRGPDTDSEWVQLWLDLAFQEPGYADGLGLNGILVRGWPTTETACAELRQLAGRLEVPF
jgi:hypothetical protein